MREASAPATLWLVRHGQSVGNVAQQRADAAGSDVIEIGQRDMDVELSPLGREQADAFGAWLARRPPEEAPTVVYASPYRRARETAERALAGCRPPLGDLTLRVDERLRDRDLGALDRLTGRGIKARFPAEAELRARVGKFYHRPPGGESWTDVLLRLRAFLATLAVEQPGERVLVFTHDVVVLLFRYILEDLDEEAVLRIGREDPVANAGLTSYRWCDPGWELVAYNQVEPLRREGTPVSDEQDERVDAG